MARGELINAFNRIVHRNMNYKKKNIITLKS